MTFLIIHLCLTALSGLIVIPACMVSSRISEGEKYDT